MERRIEHVRDVVSGEEHVAQEFFARGEGFVFQQRRRCADDNRQGRLGLVCSVCSQPLYIAGTPKQELVFKHYKERGDCPIKTKGELSQDDIDRMRYAGQRESALHIQLKEEVAAALQADSTRCSEVNVEKIRFSSTHPELWRKPDVSCVFNGKKMVFEIQLTTTYLNVIADRESHYREDSTFILWLFSHFDPDGLKFIHKDIYQSNHGNAFVFDEAARIRSAASQKLVLHCYRLLNPAVGISGGWVDSFVELADLQYDTTDFRSYLTLPARHQLAAEFEAFWLQRQDLPGVERWKLDEMFEGRFQEVGVPYDMTKLHRLFDLLYSLKSGRVVGYRFPNYLNGLLRIGHNFFDSHKAFFPFFFRVLKHYGKTADVKKADRDGKLWKRVLEVKGLKDRSAYAFPKEYVDAVRLLFPELPESLF